VNDNADRTAYTYDAQDRLTQVTLPDASVVQYGYDADGRRVVQQVDTEATQFLWDELSPYGDVVLETDGDGDPIVSYTLVDTRLISQRRDGATSYYLPDGQGSVRALADSTGTITNTYAYAAFGELYSQTGTTTNSYFYTGQRYDDLAGLYHLRARYYDSAVGRFLSRDPYPVNLQDPFELNRYVYAANNPVNLLDPTGYTAFIEATLNRALVGGAAAALLYQLGNYLVITGSIIIAGLIVGWAASEVLQAERDKVGENEEIEDEWVDYDVLDEVRRILEDNWNNGDPVPPGGPSGWYKVIVAALLTTITAGVITGTGDPQNVIEPNPAPDPNPDPSPDPREDPDRDRDKPRDKECEEGVDPQCDDSRTIILYHYTKVANIASIQQNGLRPSSRDPDDPKSDAQWGDGQYFTDLAPHEAEEFTRAQVSQALYKTPRKWGTRGRLAPMGWVAFELPIARVYKEPNRVTRVTDIFPSEVKRQYPGRGIWYWYYPNTATLPPTFIRGSGSIQFQPMAGGGR